jgi:hypothetical protein
LRTTTVGCVYPKATDNYKASDILQTTPTTITDPTYLASSGIQIGPGVDLVTKSAGDKGFSTYIYPTILYYGLKGNIISGANPGATAWCWPGTQAFLNAPGGAGIFPDTTTNPKAFFRIQQPTLVSGLSATLGTLPTVSDTVVLTVAYTPGGTGTYATTLFTITFTSTSPNSQQVYNLSTRLNTGDYLHLQLYYTGANVGTGDLSCQIDLF